ncbi:AraC-like DNA-binding protein [Rhizobium sp. SG_E_25_P2]|uniref:AraC family transcriptional regulator n=1 Tax=Rhizobium sp. SG_E_25_P2 TaxID=2879942 RepID=UPI0024766154|nr:AraC family transcriptional regulator [Rhizobium sp. SG_E_25_P2]MDH6264677.1 AraC-like DNA-binding protein [Rhizobium sp. SG_E_25_P2]
MAGNKDRRLARTESAGLERLCAEGDHIRRAPDAEALERIEVVMSRFTYAAHRHDSYALGLTISGAQTFFYRGERRLSLPGQWLALHPDELHDGQAGDDAGLRYRMLYLEPSRLYDALPEGIMTLPFLQQPVGDDPLVTRLLAGLLSGMEDGIDPLALDGCLAELAARLATLAGLAKGRSVKTTPDMRQIRDYLVEHAFEQVTSDDLERVSGLNRYQIARAFRRMHGSSPHRFLVMRRLQAARKRIGEGADIADVAAETGFADQAHLTRWFRNAYGTTPARWAQMARARTA